MRLTLATGAAPGPGSCTVGASSVPGGTADPLAASHPGSPDPLRVRPDGSGPHDEPRRRNHPRDIVSRSVWERLKEYDRADFQAATAAFDRFAARGKSLGMRGLRSYDKDVLWTCLKQAFAKSRVSAEEASKVLPYARRALNDELVRLYVKLEAL